MTKTSLERRMSGHVHASKSRKSKLYDAMNSYGIDNFEIKLVKNFKNKKECELAEINLIKEAGYYNLAPGGIGGFVVRDKNAWIEKLKKARKGKTPAKGMRHTQNNKKLFSEVSRNYWKTQKTYDWEKIKKYSHKDAKKFFGISTTHYYRLKKRFEISDLK